MQKGLTTTDKLERKTDKVGAGSTFTVQTISVVGGVTWYTMFAAVAGKASNASDGMYFGAIKVAWLTGQTIELVE